jgi:hypothetical protein
MTIIQIIKEKLKKYPQISFEETENYISVLPVSDDGFTVSLEINQNIFKVFYNGWHEDFEDEEKALNCFAFGLSNECRLKEFRRNNQPYKWAMEYKNGKDWIEDITTGLLIFAVWQKQTIHYLQNDLIK